MLGHQTMDDMLGTRQLYAPLLPVPPLKPLHPVPLVNLRLALVLFGDQLRIEPLLVGEL